MNINMLHEAKQVIKEIMTLQLKWHQGQTNNIQKKKDQQENLEIPKHHENKSK